MRKLKGNTDGGASRQYQNVREYISGLRAAIRTHQRLTSGSPLRLEVRDDGRIPLAQRILLR